MGDKCEILQPECIRQGRQVGDKCKITQPEHPERIGDKGDKWKTNMTSQTGGRQVRPEWTGRQGRQGRDKCKIMPPTALDFTLVSHLPRFFLTTLWVLWAPLFYTYLLCFPAVKTSAAWQKRKSGDECKIMWSGHATLSKE